MFLVIEFKGGVAVRVWNTTNGGQFSRHPVGLVLHAVVDQFTQRVELCSAAEPHLSLVCFHTVIHVFVALRLWGSGVEVFQLGILFD